MGGLVCYVRRDAILQFQSVPTVAAQIPIFDAQLRQLYAAPDIAETIVAEAPTKVKLVCDTLSKSTWTAADRTALLDVIEGLYASTPYT